MSALIVHEQQLIDCCPTSIGESQITEKFRARLLSLSKEKSSDRYTPTDIGYAPPRYVAVIVILPNDANLLASPQSALYANAEAGVAWRQMTGAIVETTDLNNNIWRLVIDPAKPLPT